MILEVLGIIIAFTTTMLLFSLFITTLVQVFNFRDIVKFIFMKKGMTKLAEHISAKSTSDLTFKNEIFEKISAVIGKGIAYNRKAYTSFEEIYSAYKAANPQSSIDEEEIRRWFELVEDETRAMFKRFADVISFIAAVILVIVMQLDSFELLSKLSNNKEYRQSLMIQGEGIAGGEFEKIKTFNSVILSFNETFVETYASDYIIVEQLSGEGNKNAQDAIEEFQSILNSSNIDPDERTSLKQAYNDAIVDAYTAWQDNSRKILGAQYAALIEFDFKPFPNEWTIFDYIKRFFGLLLSAILISLGAPFWFNTLKKVVGFKNAIAMQFDQNKAKSASNSQ